MFKILAIDDNFEDIAFLEDFGYSLDCISKNLEIFDELTGKEVLYDMVIVDIQLSLVSGWEVLAFLKNHPVFQLLPIVVISQSVDKKDELLSLKAGVDDFIRKPFDRDILLARLDLILVRYKDFRKRFFDLRKLPFVKSQEDYSPLTAREKTVFSMIAQGDNNEKISQELCLSLLTVKTHVKKIFKKLMVNNRTEAVIVGMYLGLIDF